MADLGGNLFEGVAFPIAFGDRYVAITSDRLTGAPLLDVYRWDRKEGRLVVELFHGRPLPSAPPVTVDAAGSSGAVRLGVAADSPGAVVGYLAGGDDPRSVRIMRDRIQVLRGDDVVFEMLGTSMAGLPIGLRIDEGGGVGIGAGLPVDFPRRRVFRDAPIVMTELVGLPPLLVHTDLERCTLLGPAIVAVAGPNVVIRRCSFPPAPTEFLWELPPIDGEVVGVIGLVECLISDCTFEGVGVAVIAGTREQVRREMFG